MVRVCLKWAVGFCLAVWGHNAMSAGFSENFESIDPHQWYVANYDFAHPAFDTDWRADQVRADLGLEMILTPKSEGENRFNGASVRRHAPTGYGRYEVVMQPSRGEGFVTGFFTYTGPHYGTQHDEIDIEFLGKNTRQIHIATFVDGKLWNKFVDLGFDAADAPRAYSFEWRENGVRWFVGDRLLFERRKIDGLIPSEKGRLFANIWAGDPSIKVWSGLADPAGHGLAKVNEIKFTPFEAGTGTLN